MTPAVRRFRSILAAMALLCWAGELNRAVLANEPKPSTEAAAPASPTSPPAYVTESLRGRVVWLGEALRQFYGVEFDADFEKSLCVLAGPEGEIHPLVKDTRGRGFWLDPRLRDIDLELLVRRFPHSPMVQVIRVYSLKDGKKYLLDYWCDICSIPMFELKACECCQGPTRIRLRAVSGDDAGEEATDEASNDQPPGTKR